MRAERGRPGRVGERGVGERGTGKLGTGEQAAGEQGKGEQIAAAGPPARPARPTRAGGAPRASAPHPLEPEASLEARLGHHFTQPELLRRALTHRSLVFDTGARARGGGLADGGSADGGSHAGSLVSSSDAFDPAHDNEQLEFLGDAVLGLLVAEALCVRFAGLREGDLTRMRAALVSRKHLGAVGGRLELGRFLRLGETAERNAGRTNPGLFSNAVEAVLAALYLDGGLPVARRFVEQHVLDEATVASLDGDRRGRGGTADASPGLRALNDWKTTLQERVQAAGLGRAQYSLLAESGPDHRRLFRVEVRLLGESGLSAPLGAGEGSTKKSAQQEAARLALHALAVDRARPPDPTSGARR